LTNVEVDQHNHALLTSQKLCVKDLALNVYEQHQHI